MLKVGVKQRNCKRCGNLFYTFTTSGKICTKCKLKGPSQRKFNKEEQLENLLIDILDNDFKELDLRVRLDMVNDIKKKINEIIQNKKVLKFDRLTFTDYQGNKYTRTVQTMKAKTKEQENI